MKEVTMLPRNLLFKVAALLLAAVMLVGLPVSSYAAQTDTWQPSQPSPGMGSVVFVNHIGQGGGLTVDLAGTIYNVSDKANDIPGRLQINLAPGNYAFTANALGTGTTRSVDVVAGQVTAISFSGAGSELVVHNTSDEDGATTRSYKFNQLAVVFEDITNQVR
jgi:hypothetical protein